MNTKLWSIFAQPTPNNQSMSSELIMLFQTNFIEPFIRRLLKELWPVLILGMVVVVQMILMLTVLQTPWLFNAFFPFLFIIIAIFDYSRSYAISRDYITKLYIDGENLIIEYVVKNKVKYYKGNTKTFNVKLEGLFFGKRGKLSSPSLVLYQNDGEFMKQSCFGSWTKEEIYRVYDLMVGNKAFQKEIAITGEKV
ncbi:MAG: hypothetical protein NTX03_12380 [Bacteroidetes bacterium]|nr:hypothetical protein [Bacteroidota bacterium]